MAFLLPYTRKVCDIHKKNFYNVQYECGIFKLRLHTMKSLKALQKRQFISLHRSYCTETLQ